MKTILLLFILITLQSEHSKSQTLVTHGFEYLNYLNSPAGYWAQISFSSMTFDRNDDLNFVKSGIRSAIIETSATQGGFCNLISNTFAVEAGKTYRISFWYRAKTAADSCQINLQILPGQYVGTTLATPWTKSGINNTTFAEQVIDYVAPASQTITINFNAGGIAGKGGLFLDDIAVNVLTATAVSNVNMERWAFVTRFTDNPAAQSVTIQFNDNYKGTAQVIVMGINGTVYSSKQVTVNNSNATLYTNQLAAGNYILRVVGLKGKTATLRFVKK